MTKKRDDESTDRQKEPKVKVTYCLPVRLKRLIDNMAADLGIDPCDVVIRLMTPALKGVCRPTIPPALRLQLGEDAESAA